MQGFFHLFLLLQSSSQFERRLFLCTDFLCAKRDSTFKHSGYTAITNITGIQRQEYVKEKYRPANGAGEFLNPLSDYLYFCFKHVFQQRSSPPTAVNSLCTKHWCPWSTAACTEQCRARNDNAWLHENGINALIWLAVRGITTHDKGLSNYCTHFSRLLSDCLFFLLLQWYSGMRTNKSLLLWLTSLKKMDSFFWPTEKIFVSLCLTPTLLLHTFLSSFLKVLPVNLREVLKSHSR